MSAYLTTSQLSAEQPEGPQQGTTYRGGLSSTIQAVADELDERPVAVRDIVDAILARHEKDYVAGRHRQLTPAWPAVAPARPIARWLEQIRTLFRPDVFEELFGRAVILGAALADPSSGRAMEGSGLFHQVALELQPTLPEALTSEGHEALASLPLAAALAGVALARALRVAEPAARVALSGDSRFAAGRSLDGTVAVWDVRRGVQTWTHAYTSAPQPDGLWLNRDGSMLAVATGETVELRTSASTALMLPNVFRSSGVEAQVGQLSSGVSWCSFSNPGDPVAVAVAYARGSIELYALPAGDVSTAGSLAQTATVSRMVLRTSRLLTASGDGTVRLWDVVTRSELAAFSHERASVTAVELDAFGALVVSGDDKGKIRVWDPNSQAVRSSAEHGGPVRCLALSADGRFLASGGDDGFVRLWRVDGLIELGRLPHPGAQITDLAFDTSGTALVATATDGVARRWELFVEPPLAPSYLPDQVPDEEVPSWIDDDVDAFARLIASRHMSPPVSIAIFGDWGSGKTFFMRRLQQRVGRLARQARDSGLQQRDIGYYKHRISVGRRPSRRRGGCARSAASGHHGGRCPGASGRRCAPGHQVGLRRQRVGGLLQEAERDRLGAQEGAEPEEFGRSQGSLLNAPERDSPRSRPPSLGDSPPCLRPGAWPSSSPRARRRWPALPRSAPGRRWLAPAPGAGDRAWRPRWERQRHHHVACVGVGTRSPPPVAADGSSARRDPGSECRVLISTWPGSSGGSRCSTSSTVSPSRLSITSIHLSRRDSQRTTPKITSSWSG